MDKYRLEKRDYFDCLYDHNKQLHKIRWKLKCKKKCEIYGDCRYCINSSYPGCTGNSPLCIHAKYLDLQKTDLLKKLVDNVTQN